MTAIVRPLKWGILGVAKINNRLKPAFHASQTVMLQGIASRSLERAKAGAAELGVANAYGSYEEMLDDPEIEAIYNPLPNSMHAEWTKKAADHGKHVLCEKPLCPTAAEAAELVTYCRSRGVRLMDGFMWPHHPRTHRIRQMLDQGTIGQVQRVVAAFTFLMNPLNVENIRLQPDMGGGSLLDVGCYPVFGIRWAFGAEPVSVFARAKMFNGVDVEMAAVLTFADGRTAVFDCGFTQPFRGWMEIVGERGVIDVPEMWLPKPRAVFYVAADEKPKIEHAVDGHDQMVHMLDDFAAAVRGGHEATPSPDEAVKSLRVMDALTRSVRERREVAVEA